MLLRLGSLPGTVYRAVPAALAVDITVTAPVFGIYGFSWLPILEVVSDPHPGVSQRLSPKDFVFLFIGGSLIRGKPFFVWNSLVLCGRVADECEESSVTIPL